MVLRISYKSSRIFLNIYTRIFFIRSTNFAYIVYFFIRSSYILRTSYIVYRISYIRRYADTFIVIYFLKDNQFLLFIVLICRTCKCLLKYCTDNVQQKNSMWTLKLVNEFFTIHKIQAWYKAIVKKYVCFRFPAGLIFFYDTNRALEILCKLFF